MQAFSLALFAIYTLCGPAGGADALVVPFQRFSAPFNAPGSVMFSDRDYELYDKPLRPRSAMPTQSASSLNMLLASPTSSSAVVTLATSDSATSSVSATSSESITTWSTTVTDSSSSTTSSVIATSASQTTSSSSRTHTTSRSKSVKSSPSALSNQPSVDVAAPVLVPNSPPPALNPVIAPSATPSGQIAGEDGLPTVLPTSKAGSKPLTMGLGVLIGAVCVCVLAVLAFFGHRAWKNRLQRKQWDTRTYSDMSAFSRFSVQSIFHLPRGTRIDDDHDHDVDQYYFGDTRRLVPDNSLRHMSSVGHSTVSRAPTLQSFISFDQDQSTLPVPPQPSHSHSRSRSRTNPLPILPPLDLSRSATRSSTTTETTGNAGEVELTITLPPIEEAPYTGMAATPGTGNSIRRRNRSPRTSESEVDASTSLAVPVPTTIPAPIFSRRSKPSVRLSIQKNTGGPGGNLITTNPNPFSPPPPFTPTPQTPNTYARGQSRALYRTSRLSMLPLYTAPQAHEPADSHAESSRHPAG